MPEDHVDDRMFSKASYSGFFLIYQPGYTVVEFFLINQDVVNAAVFLKLSSSCFTRH